MTLVLDFFIAWLISDNEINGKNINTNKYKKKLALKKNCVKLKITQVTKFSDCLSCCIILLLSH